jgi:hypothetical protein
MTPRSALADGAHPRSIVRAALRTSWITAGSTVLCARHHEFGLSESLARAGANEPSCEDDPYTKAYEGSVSTKCAHNHDGVTREPDDRASWGHVRQHILTPPGGTKLGEVASSKKSRGSDRREVMDQESLNTSLPQEHGRRARGRDVGGELGQVDLVQEELLPIYCHD